VAISLGGEEELPKRYYLDESDPDVVVLLRDGGTSVAAFIAGGATRKGIVKAAREGHVALITLRA
jgi:hypothetical protein